MDLEVAKTLSQLQERKVALESSADLEDKCDTIVELDRRVGDLLEEFKTLHIDVERRFGFLQNDQWDQLGQPYRVLTKTNLILDLLIVLNRLNKICHRLSTNPNLAHTNERIQLKLPRSATLDGENPNDTEERNPTVLQVLDLVDDFETTYQLFEPYLSKRTDLPYGSYATRVRELKRSIGQLGRPNDRSKK